MSTALTKCPACDEQGEQRAIAAMGVCESCLLQPLADAAAQCYAALRRFEFVGFPEDVQLTLNKALNALEEVM